MTKLDTDQTFGVISDFLSENLPGFGPLLGWERLTGGQSNPTFKLSCAEGALVLRRKPPGQLLNSAHAIDREYRVLKALEGSDVPVGKVHAYCDDPTILGSEFYVMEFLQGRVLSDPALPGFSNDDRKSVYRSMGKTLAAIHSVDIVGSGLGTFGRPGSYFERQIKRWTKQYRVAETAAIPEMDALIDWVTLNCVVDDERSALVHGDYRLDNVMLHAQHPKIVAVMDWELSTIGHPFADIAYQCMQWRLPNTELSRGLGQLDRPALGIPSERDYVSAYCEYMGIAEIEHWDFYLMFSFFRLAAIVQGIKVRAAKGNAASERAQKVGDMVQPLARQAMSIIQ